MPALGGKFNYWEITAEDNDTAYKLVQKWVRHTHTGTLPRSGQALMHELDEAIRWHDPLGLVVRDAHRMRFNALKDMHQLAEKGVMVILQGQIPQILAASVKVPDFYQRACYLLELSPLPNP